MKTRSKILFGALCSSALIASSGFSQDGERPRPPGGAPTEGRNPGDLMKRSDTDGDGKVSKAEFLNSRNAEMEEAFGRIDANGDGFVDEAEAKEIGERMRAAGGRDGGGNQPGRGGPEGMRRPEGGEGRPAPEGARRPEGDRPEGGRPEGGRPEGGRPEGGRPEGGRPDGARPEGGPSGAGAGAAYLEQAFGRMDQDGNGQLSREEFNQGIGRMREMMGSGGGRPGGPEGMRRPEGGPAGGGEGGFRRPPQQGGEGAGKPRPELEGDKPAPEKKDEA